MKFWWPHNEAIIATLLAYQLTGDPKYADWHRKSTIGAIAFPGPRTWRMVWLPPPTGRVTSPLKGNLWKGPFHLPRMQWCCLRILAQ